MVTHKSAVLQLTLPSSHESSARLEFQPLESDVDGIWIRTSVTMPNFKAEFSWFLASSSQSSLAESYSDVIYGRAVPQFVVRDTDCSFGAYFTPNLSRSLVDVAVEFGDCLEGAGPAVHLSIQNATTPMSDFQAFLNNLCHFD
jgi:hypothetical protein